MSGLTKRQAAFLAALLDADGRPLTYGQLGRVIGTSGLNDRHALYQYALRVRRLGIGGVTNVLGYGYRMDAIPPDWALDDVLTLLDALRREDYCLPVWAWRRTA